MIKNRGSKRTIDGSVKAPASSDSKIVVAVDFGTTSSALAYSYTADPEDTATITAWPDTASGSLEGETRDKVPT